MPITAEEFSIFKKYVDESCGVQLSSEKSYLLETRFASLMAQTGSRDFHDFYSKIQADKSGKLRESIIDVITTHETYWFRDERPWKAMRKTIFPKFATQLRLNKKQKIRIWCAACSSGQEPYSLAMMIDAMVREGEMPAIKPDQFEIVGTDISPGTLFLANAGRYNAVEVNRGLPPGWKERYFKPDGQVWLIDEKIRNRIKFRRHNLRDDLFMLGNFDLVLCRNVAIYFSEDFKRQLFARISRALTPEGILFLGATESLLGMSTAFNTKDSEGAAYYELKPTAATTPPISTPTPRP